MEKGVAAARASSSAVFGGGREGFGCGLAWLVQRPENGGLGAGRRHAGGSKRGLELQLTSGPSRNTGSGGFGAGRRRRCVVPLFANQSDEAIC